MEHVSLSVECKGKAFVGGLGDLTETVALFVVLMFNPSPGNGFLRRLPATGGGGEIPQAYFQF